MRFEYASASDRGPRPQNEDAVGVWLPPSGGIIAAVADGLGGQGAGSVASQIAISVIAESVSSISPSMFSELPLLIHGTIRREQEGSAEKLNMATTLTAAWLSGNRLRGVHCGDSRLSLARANGIRRLSEDHSEGARLLSVGKISKEEYEDYPRRHILDSALGVRGEGPTIQKFDFELEPNDWVILTTDGVHQKIASRSMRDLAMASNTADVFLGKLLAQLAAVGPTDNYSAVVVRCMDTVQ